MERRELLRLLTSLGAGTAVSSLVPTESAGQAPVRYESHGRGPALILGSPITASKSGRGDDPIAAIRQGDLDRFTDRYQVIVMDYPHDWRRGCGRRDLVRSRSRLCGCPGRGERRRGGTVRLVRLLLGRVGGPSVGLERLGRAVRLVERARHDLFTRPEVVVPLVRAFLDPILLPG